MNGSGEKLSEQYSGQKRQFKQEQNMMSSGWYY